MAPRIRLWIKATLYALGLTVLIYFAQWVHLLNLIGIDTALERQFLTLSSHTVDRAAIDKLRVIYIDQKNNGPLGAFDDPVSRQAWRAQHAKLLLALEEAGASVVAFDITFAPSVSDAVAGTQEFARAIAEVRDRGRTRVIVGYGSDPDIDRDILAAMPCEKMGFVQVARQPQDTDGKHMLSSVLVADASVQSTADTDNSLLRRPLPMGLAIFLAARASTNEVVEPGIDARRRQVVFFGNARELKPITVDVRDVAGSPSNCTPGSETATIRRLALLPVWMGEGSPFIERSYASVVLQPKLSKDYAGKIVLVGARVADDLVAVGPETGGGTVWGYQVHARVLADLSSETYLRHVGELWIFLALLLLLVIGVIAGLTLPKTEIKTNVPWIGTTPIPLGLLLVAAVHAFILIQLLRYNFVLYDIGYQWLALIAGYYVVSRPFKPRAPGVAP